MIRLDRPEVNQAIFGLFGFAVAMASLQGAHAFADVLLLGAAGMAALRGHRGGPGILWLLPIGGLLSAIAGANFGLTLWFTARLCGLIFVGTYLVAADPASRRSLIVGLLLGSFFHVLQPNFLVPGLTGRARGLTENAIIFGQLGLLLWLLLPKARDRVRLFEGAVLMPLGGAMVILSGTRAAALAIFVWGVARRSPAVIMVGVVLAIFTIIHFDRLAGAYIDQGIEQRIAIAKGEFDAGSPELTPMGYGFGAYRHGVGIDIHSPRQHNMFTAAAYELGIWIVFPAIVLFAVVSTRQLPLSLFAVLLAWGMFSDQPYGAPPGQYAWTLLFVWYAEPKRVPAWSIYLVRKVEKIGEITATPVLSMIHRGIAATRSVE